MITKRSFLLGAMSVAIGDVLPSFGAESSFDELLDQADPALFEAARGFREGAIFELASHKGPAPRRNGSDLPVSDDAIKLLIKCEVTSREHYEQTLQPPTLPPKPSGITIGIGYDIGWVKPSWLDAEWPDLNAATRERLKGACGMHGRKARPLLLKLNDIRVPWQIAEKQFRTVMLKLYAGETVAALPNAQKLSPDCFGALVDLVYNRGASFRAQGDRYAEMNAIYVCMRNEDYESIPDALEAMTHIWDGTYAGQRAVKGLVVRRKLEAALFRKGLKEHT